MENLKDAINTFKRGFQVIEKLREKETNRSLFLFVGLGLLVVGVWLNLPEFILGIIKGVAIACVMLGAEWDYEQPKPKKRRKI